MKMFDEAHVHWDAQWRSQAGRAAWSRPEPWVMEVIGKIRTNGSRRVLDVGCGVGRHAHALARAGFETYGVDRSEAGLGYAGRLAESEQIELWLQPADFRSLPFESGTFDYVLAWNVVYHGTEEDLAVALSEVHRVLRPGGLYQATMLSKRNGNFGKGIEVAANTYVQPEATDDKIHPHLFCDAGDIARLHSGWHALEAFEALQDGPESYHWNLLFQRPGPRPEESR